MQLYNCFKNGLILRITQSVEKRNIFLIFTHPSAWRIWQFFNMEFHPSLTYPIQPGVFLLLD